MLELGSLFKSFLLAVLLMFALQTKIGSHTAETYLTDWLRTSAFTSYVQEVAAGAVVVINQTATTAKNFISEKLGHRDSSTQAGRLNIELERSEQYQKTHPANEEEE